MCVSAFFSNVSLTTSRTSSMMHSLLSGQIKLKFPLIDPMKITFFGRRALYPISKVPVGVHTVIPKASFHRT